jgi:hypothetical protein
LGKKATHKVACAICGKEGEVAVGKGEKIADKSWSFFGKFNVNYEAAASILKLEQPDFAKSESVPIEYWECEDCYKDMERILKNER